MTALQHTRGCSLARWLIWIYALGQLSVLLHPLLVDHAICPHGKVVDVAHHEGSDHGCGHPHGDQDNGADHHGCQHLAFLTAPQAVDAGSDEQIEIAPLAAKIPVVELAERDHWSAEIYLISPSNSPPVHG